MTKRSEVLSGSLSPRRRVLSNATRVPSGDRAGKKSGTVFLVRRRTEVHVSSLA
jgi:hypothetical protein